MLITTSRVVWGSRYMVTEVVTWFEECCKVKWPIGESGSDKSVVPVYVRSFCCCKGGGVVDSPLMHVKELITTCWMGTGSFFFPLLISPAWLLWGMCFYSFNRAALFISNHVKKHSFLFQLTLIRPPMCCCGCRHGDTGKWHNMYAYFSHLLLRFTVVYSVLLFV